MELKSYPYFAHMILNLIILNNTEKCNKENIESTKNMLNNINPSAYILEAENRESFNLLLRESEILENTFFKKIKVKINNSSKHLRRKESEK